MKRQIAFYILVVFLVAGIALDIAYATDALKRPGFFTGGPVLLSILAALSLTMLLILLIGRGLQRWLLPRHPWRGLVMYLVPVAASFVIGAALNRDLDQTISDALAGDQMAGGLIPTQSLSFYAPDGLCNDTCQHILQNKLSTQVIILTEPLPSLSIGAQTAIPAPKGATGVLYEFTPSVSRRCPSNALLERMDSFDLQILNRRAKSCLTAVSVTNHSTDLFIQSADLPKPQRVRYFHRTQGTRPGETAPAFRETIVFYDRFGTPALPSVDRMFADPPGLFPTRYTRTQNTSAGMIYTLQRLSQNRQTP